VRAHRNFRDAAATDVPDPTWRTPVDTRTIEVEHRLGELRRCAAVIRAERASAARAPDLGPFGGLRLALGQRLIAAGQAL
jgi:hypothetical protein